MMRNVLTICRLSAYSAYRLYEEGGGVGGRGLGMSLLRVGGGGLHV